MKRCKFCGWLPLVVATVLLAEKVAHAFGPKTESQKREERYIKCILAIEDADKDDDDKISREEFQPFVKALGGLLFAANPIHGEDLPQDLAELYKPLVVASGGEGKGGEIDVFGASVTEVRWLPWWIVVARCTFEVLDS